MVTIRLRRMGCNNAPAYRVVATDTRFPRDGKFLEVLGSYDPKQKENNVRLDLDRIAYWQSKGAKCSETVASLIKRFKTA